MASPCAAASRSSFSTDAASPHEVARSLSSWRSTCPTVGRSGHERGEAADSSWQCTVARRGTLDGGPAVFNGTGYGATCQRKVRSTAVLGQVEPTHVRRPRKRLVESAVLLDGWQCRRIVTRPLSVERR